MRTTLSLTGTVLLALAPRAVAQTTEWFQTCDRQTILFRDDISCRNLTTGITDNWYHRVFDLSNVQTTEPAPIGCGPNPSPVSVLGSDQLVTEIRAGISSSTTVTGTRAIRFSIFDVSSTAGAPQDPLTAPVLGAAEVVFADATAVHLVVPVDPPILIPDSTTHVQLTMMVDNGQPQGDFFFPGSNFAGQFPDASSYISAPDCGIIMPVSYTKLGFPDVHLLLELTTRTSVGTSYCGPAVANSTGAPGLILAGGSAAVADNDLTLFANQLPPGRFGFFLASQQQDFVQPPGSDGFLCLGPPCARFTLQEQIITGPSGSIAVDLTALPLTPPVAVMPGDTWSFQCWYRDAGPPHTSNLTDATAVTFR